MACRRGPWPHSDFSVQSRPVPSRVRSRVRRSIGTAYDCIVNYYQCIYRIGIQSVRLACSARTVPYRRGRTSESDPTATPTVTNTMRWCIRPLERTGRRLGLAGMGNQEGRGRGRPGRDLGRPRSKGEKGVASRLVSVVTASRTAAAGLR